MSGHLRKHPMLESFVHAYVSFLMFEGDFKYPAGWSVKVKGESFVIQPFVADQEVYTSTPIYWEGASSITGAGGKTLGRAYVELNGYCPPTP